MDEEKTFTLKEILYIVRKYLLLELIIVIVALSVGGVIALTNKDVYVASCRISVKANLNQNISYNDTSLSQIVMPTIEDLISNNSVIIDKAKEKSGKNISVSSIKATHQEESLIMTVSYTDESKDDAREKLNALISAAQEVVKEPSSDYNEKAKEAKDNLYDTIISIDRNLNTLDKDSTEYKELAALLAAAKAAYSYIETGTAMSKYFFAIIELEPVQSEPIVVKQNNDLRVILISALIGVVLAVVAAILIYFISDRVETEENLEKVTAKPNLISVPGKRSRKNKIKDLAPLDLTELSDTLMFAKEKDKSVVYQVQSSTHSEGKSTIAANLGINFGKTSRKTLIIDCDFNKRKIRRLLGVKDYADMMEYFKENLTFNEIISHTDYDNLDLITASNDVENHTLVFTSEKFADLIKEARKNYEFIILDCGPVGLISDYINISKHVDGTILVVARNYVKSIALKNTVKSLDACDAKVMGTVFNFCDKKRDYYYKNYNEQVK